MKHTWWKSGEWNALCDVCGFKFKDTELKLRWDGLMVCSKDWETRHPQELIRPLPTEKAPKWTRPEGTDQFISITYNSNLDFCSVEGRFCQADYLEADCASVGNINGALIP